MRCRKFTRAELRRLVEIKTGKTDAVREIAGREGVPVVEFEMVAAQSDDMLGLPTRASEAE